MLAWCSRGSSRKGLLEELDGPSITVPDTLVKVRNKKNGRESDDSWPLAFQATGNLN